MATKKKTEAKSFKDMVLGFEQSAVEQMGAEIEASLDRRHTFEIAQGLQLTGGTSWEKASKQARGAKVALARLFLALDIKPANVFERRLVEGKMFNAKSIKKIVEMAQYACGMNGKLERVTRAFIACAILADRREPGSAITNTVNSRFLNSKDLAAFITDREILDNLEELRHKSMSAGADTQSSQARNVLDGLGLGEVCKVDRERDAIRINAKHPRIEMFATEFLA